MGGGACLWNIITLVEIWGVNMWQESFVECSVGHDHSTMQKSTIRKGERVLNGSFHSQINVPCQKYYEILFLQ